MDLNVIYFYTVAIVDWIPLMKSDKFKSIVLDSLIHLVKKEKLIVYGFVIMPNHIHIIWECKAKKRQGNAPRKFYEVYRSRFFRRVEKNE